MRRGAEILGVVPPRRRILRDRSDDSEQLLPTTWIPVPALVPGSSQSQQANDGNLNTTGMCTPFTF